MNITVNTLHNSFYILGIERWDTTMEEVEYTEYRLKILIWEICFFKKKLS